MTDYIGTLNKALEDPEIPNLGTISSNNRSRLVDLCNEMPSGALVSEWRYGVGEICYKFYMHTNGICATLKEAFEKGIRGGGPRRLENLYSKEDLLKIIRAPEADSADHT